MFTTLSQKITLGIYIFLLLSIPVGAYLVSESQSQNTKTSAATVKKPITKASPSPTPSPIKATEDLKRLSESSASPDEEETSGVLAETSSVTYGPTLNLKLLLEGRPTDKQASRTFVGIAEGTPTSNIKYLLSFTVDVPASGEFKGLSLAGLDAGTQYTAFIKPVAQIATSSAFVMSPSETNLSTLTTLTGDLNEDNQVNDTDITIAKTASGATPNDSNWNSLADFNLDNKINALDIAFLYRNYGKIGASGVWGSTPPSATSSATASQAVTSQGATSGYWIWIPR